MIDALRTPDERFADLPGWTFAPRYVDLPAVLLDDPVDLGQPQPRTAAFSRAAFIDAVKTLRQTRQVVRRDAEGYFYLVDRKHDMIVTGALNVYPSEVERALAEHPGVADSAVVGLSDERWGEAVTAFVVRRPESELTDETLRDFCRDRLAGYKRPKAIHFLDEIPRNPAGKPLRRVLKERYAAGPVTSHA